MAIETADDVAVDAKPEAQAPASGRLPGFLTGRTFKIGALLAAVMAVEAAVVYLLPKPATSDAPAGAADPSGQAADDGPATSDLDTAEVHIGKFNCTNGRATNGVIHLTFELVAIVARDQELNFADAIGKQFRYSVRQAVVKIARSSSLEDLDDPNLSTMKRLIREEINKVLHKSYVIEVVISDFQRMEQ